MLFQVLTERGEKNSVAIASNESFGGWTKTFTDPRLCTAIVDRLTFNGTIIETGTDSYRLASTRARAEEPVQGRLNHPSPPRRRRGGVTERLWQYGRGCRGDAGTRVRPAHGGAAGVCTAGHPHG